MTRIRIRSALAGLSLLAASLSAGLLTEPAWAQHRAWRSINAVEPAGRPVHLSKNLMRQQAEAQRTGRARPVPVMVRLHGDPLATNEGAAGLAPTTPRKLGTARLDSRSAASQQYLQHMNSRHRAFEASVRGAIPNARLGHRYQAVFNGMSMVVPSDRLAALAALPGVAAIYEDRLEKPTTDVSPTFIGATELWRDRGGRGVDGEGVIVGVLDSGIWPEHPSLRDPDAFGKPYRAPPGPARPCEFNVGSQPGPAFACNNKLIGARVFMSTYEAQVGLLPTEFSSARDADGHGTHTATTAAGNRHVNASIAGRPLGHMAGVAPRAHVMVYKVCGEEGCYNSDSVAAVNQAILDGVDVINFSISGGSDPYSNAVSLAFLQAVEAGVVVAASAGNSGPAPDTVDHREPWTITVGATTSDRQFAARLDLSAASGASLALSGASITPAVGPATVVVPTDTACLFPFAPGSVAGRIVVCERGGNDRPQKSFNVKQGGAVGMILLNPPALRGISPDNHFVPTVHLEQESAAALKSFLAAQSGVTARLGAGQAIAQQGDLMAAFSSRGGTGQKLGVSKPDLTAPGVQILAGQTPSQADPSASPPNELFQIIQGTSMSSPHVAGAAALLRQLRPNWTPAQIKSALMTTATTHVRKEDGSAPASPFDRGSGRIDLVRAADPGLLFDETAANYIALQSSLWHANLPSLYLPGFVGRAAVERTLQNTRSVRRDWRLSVVTPGDLKVTVPPVLSVPASGKATLSIAVEGPTIEIGGVRHAVLELRHPQEHTLRFPITVVRNTPEVSLAHACAPSTILRNQTVNCTVTLSHQRRGASSVAMTLGLPRNRLDLVPGSVSNATAVGNGLVFAGTLNGPADGNITITPGGTPAGSYLPLDAFPLSTRVNVGDETVVNFNVPSFRFGGVDYTRLGIVSNGYVVLGEGTPADISFDNQSFPNALKPNNVLAPFWTDLDPTQGGNVYITVLSDSVDSWLVVDWNAVREYSTGKSNSFQVWIRLGTVEDVSYGYGTLGGNGDGGFLTVGAESPNGTKGANRYFNGSGTLPTTGSALQVTSAPPTPGQVRTIGYTARGTSKGTWGACAQMNSSAYFGTQIACSNVGVTGP